MVNIDVSLHLTLADTFSFAARFLREIFRCYKYVRLDLTLRAASLLYTWSRFPISITINTSWVSEHR